MSDKDKVLFESKEYGIGAHNKIELRVLDNGEPRLWIRDGGVNALISLDKEDATKLAKALAKAAKVAPEKVECFDFTKPINKRKKVKTTSETNGVKKKRKTRSDKGKKRSPKGANYQEMKSNAIKEAMK